MEFLNTAQWMYLASFGVIFLIALVIDMTSHRGGHTPTVKNAAIWSGIWIAVGIAFAGVTWYFFGQELASLYFTGWIIEQTLAVDNLFAFIAIFAAFNLVGANSKFQ